MLTRIKRNVEFLIKDQFSWTTNRRIVVLESDDWGSIRTSSFESYNKLIELGVGIEDSYYCKYDSLESEDDLTSLFEVLSSVKDKNGRTAKLTANCLMANPDFEKIEKENFTQYYVEPVQQTFSLYSNHQNCFSLWKEGYRNKVFHPQFHGREHVNVYQWMKSLRDNLPQTRLVFAQNMFEACRRSSNEAKIRPSYLEAVAVYEKDQEELVNNIVIDGLKMFDDNFGYKSKSFIAPNYVWNEDLEKTLKENGVDYIQGAKYQREVVLNTLFDRSLKVHYTGQRNHLGQIYLVRNCNFEPTSNTSINWVDQCLNEIELAFKKNRPAIVNTHRVNYIGNIIENNRTINLILLKELLSKLIKRWPDVEFMSSDELGNLLAKKKYLIPNE